MTRDLMPYTIAASSVAAFRFMVGMAWAQSIAAAIFVFVVAWISAQAQITRRGGS